MTKPEVNLGVQALYEVALREPLHTGFPPGLLQDDCAGLSRWLASRPDARRRVREALEALDKQEKNHE
jgi:hypothetical protein